MAALFLTRRRLLLLLRQSERAALSRVLYAGRLRIHCSGPRLWSGLLLQSGLIRRSGLLFGQSLLQVVLPLQSGLTLLTGALSRLTQLRIALLAQRALLLDDLAARALRGMNLPHDALVARHLLRRDLNGRCRETSARAGTNEEARRALRE